jgi:glycosyltransferase involved in cell wall biosynthesis
MHDVQQFTYPQFFSRKELLQRKTRYLLSAKLASHHQASSSFMKNDLIKHFNFLQPSNISVIPEGVNVEEFSMQSDVNISEKYFLPKRFLYFPAQLWSHKNHITVLKALELLNQTKNIKIPLVLTGASYSGSNEIFSFIEKHPELEVFYLGKVPFKDIVALYKQARFFITAVLYESSSLPFLEAAASGCPVIASNTPPNQEMCQILRAELFDPLDYDSLANLLERVWDDDNLISIQARHNKNAINYYHWNNIALRYLKVFYTMRCAGFNS